MKTDGTVHRGRRHIVVRTAQFVMRRHGLSPDRMNIDELSHHTVDVRPGCYRPLKEGGLPIPHTRGNPVVGANSPEARVPGGRRLGGYC